MIAAGMLGDIPPKAASALDIARRNSDRLLSLINEILDLQSVETNTMQIDIRSTSLTAIVADAISEIAPFTTKLDITVNSDLPQDEIFVAADRKRAGQVLSNVLSNAAKFSPQGSIVDVRIESDETNARVLVSDCGSGLFDDDYDKVFEPFTQIDSSDTRKIGGTGLGMNISRRIMEALGGTITYRRNADIGTTFVVELPLAVI